MNREYVPPPRFGPTPPDPDELEREANELVAQIQKAVDEQSQATRTIKPTILSALIDLAEDIRCGATVETPQSLLDHANRVVEKYSSNTPRPTVVCLCGSTRFHAAFLRANYDETMAGRIVLSVAFYPDAADGVHGETVGCNLQQKEMLDELHLRRIDLCDEILILNVDGYIGESTTRERDYAISTGKRVRYWEPVRSDRP